MNILGILLMIIFVAIAGSTFFFWIKGQQILFKYITWKDAFTNPFGIKRKIPPEEWKLFKKYSLYQALCFFGGIVLMILLFILQWSFHLFIKDPKHL